MKDTSYNNDDDLDDVCNFSGINNRSYTNKYDYNYCDDFYNDVIEDDFKKTKSPKIKIHTNSNFNLLNHFTEKTEKENNSDINNKMIENNNNDNNNDILKI